MAQPSIKQLEAFWSASNAANFQAAADQLHLSVSSLSKRLLELEVAVGQQLFDRRGHRAILTEAGTRLVPLALRVLETVSALTSTMAESADIVGRYSVGVGDLSAMTWVSHFIALARKDHPRLAIELYVDFGSNLEQKLSEGLVDIAVIAKRSRLETLACEGVGQARFQWVASPSLRSVVAYGASEALRTLPLITLPPGAGTSRLLDDWILEHKASVLDRINCNSWAGVGTMLRDGLGVGFLPEGWASSLGLETIGDDHWLGRLQYALHWRQGDCRIATPKIRKLVMQSFDLSLSPWHSHSHRIDRAGLAASEAAVFDPVEPA